MRCAGATAMQACPAATPSPPPHLRPMHRRALRLHHLHRRCCRHEGLRGWHVLLGGLAPHGWLLGVGDKVVGAHRGCAARGGDGSMGCLWRDTLEGLLYLCCCQPLLLQKGPLGSLRRPPHLRGDEKAVPELAEICCCAVVAWIRRACRLTGWPGGGASGDLL